MGLTGGLSSNGQGVPAGTLRTVARTASGQSVANSTPTFLTYTTPNDGQIHAVQAVGVMVVATATETGGAIGLVSTVNGVSVTTSITAGGKTVGTTAPSGFALADPNTTVSVQQTSAQTNGSSVVTFYCALQVDG